ncbi:hypothetical protein HD554DRAFT_2292489 [Boletus coccyginus]|nr:hypothetical protein HD554DRAFT_2292489 [Boletus coccyginus]
MKHTPYLLAPLQEDVIVHRVECQRIHAALHLPDSGEANLQEGRLRNTLRAKATSDPDVLSALALILGWPVTAWVSRSGCLCTYGQSCWPSASTFPQLQSQVFQPLVYPLPTASACYPLSNPSGNRTAVLGDRYDGNWRSSMPGFMGAPNFETFMFQNGTIDAWSVPVIGIDARLVENIQAAVTFAVQQNLKLVVKCTGHDYLGRSTAPGSFVVWTHNMKNITYNRTFVPQGAPANETYEAVTLTAGVQWHEVCTAINNYRGLMVGGISVGVVLLVHPSGGWLAGRGHSMLSPSYGLGVNNALEISVVFSTGQFFTVNNYQSSDPFYVYMYQANVTNSSVLSELVGGLLRYQTQITDDGWGGYGSISGDGLIFLYVAPHMTNETTLVTTLAWHDYTACSAPFGVVSEEQTYYSPSWYELYESLVSSGFQNGGNIMSTSRLLSRDTVANNYAEVAEVLLNCSALFEWQGQPAGWRDAVVETNLVWDLSYMALIHPLSWEITPWISASLFEINWQETFFGSHCSTLKGIKDKYDLYKLFVIAKDVGSEDWNENLTCRY